MAAPGYLRPTALEAALHALAERTRTADTPALLLVAGATDIYPARVGRPFEDDVLDLSGLDELRGIRETPEGWTIGALVTWSELAGAVLPPHLDGLRQAARTIGGVQVQNRGTVVGNVCNASPAADGMPNLICLDAVVELASSRGRRRVPVSDFVTGNRRTVRAPDEIVTGVSVDAPGGTSRSAFEKLGSRSSLVISIAMAAGLIVLDGDRRVASARLAVGSCSPVARRLGALEGRLIGATLDPALAEAVEPTDLEVLSPIDDIRGTAAYRRSAALVLVKRVLRAVAA